MDSETFFVEAGANSIKFPVFPEDVPFHELKPYDVMQYTTLTYNKKLFSFYGDPLYVFVYDKLENTTSEPVIYAMAKAWFKNNRGRQ